MTVSEKIKTIDNKTGQDKAQYYLNKKIAKILAWSCGSFDKYEFLTGKDVLPENRLLEEASTIKRFECSPLGNKLKKHWHWKRSV